ncbi:MAG: DNA mismatch repair protein MutT, partial [Lactobacillus iners]|nr:DNA mismatch repair protein MutT [Lactobacillus iners]
TNHFAGKLQSSREGEVFWIERKDLENYQLADGFDSMLEIFENDNLSENCWYLKDSQWTYKNE